MRTLLQTVEKVLDHDVNLLLLGESGSGKDFFAEAIHACGNRRDKPMVKIDCAAIPAELFESELFGYEKGTFTDAQTRKLGKLETASGGTIYFDDIAALSPTLQAKLLRAIQEKRFTRLGGNQSVVLDGRVISSSSMPAEELLSGLRRDLFYRINVVTLTIPPLRERREDIPRLAKSFLARRKRGIDAEAMRMLIDYEWPGNIRELRNVIERAALLETSDVITPASLPPLSAGIVESAVRQQWTLEDLESRYIREILRDTKSNYSSAAKILGINRKTLLVKRKKYGSNEIDVIWPRSTADAELASVADRYLNRIKHFFPIEIIETAPQRGRQSENDVAIMRADSARLLAAIPAQGHVVALDERGRSIDSLKFAKWLERLTIDQPHGVIFVMGGDVGLDQSVRQRAGDVLSLSAMTLPHQLARVVLLEQIYRACTLMRNIPYHK